MDLAQTQLWEDRPFLPDQRHAVKDYIHVPALEPFWCYPAAHAQAWTIRRLVLIAALDALWASAAADCTCRAQGRQFEQGQTACLATPKGPRLATCGMVLNNSSWEFSEAPCTVSGVSTPGMQRAAWRDRLPFSAALLR